MSARLDPNRPTVPQVAPLVAALYAGPGLGNVGCCLHIVLDDGNCEDSSVDFCIQWALDRSCTGCVTLGRLLRRMSWTQRQKVRHARLRRTP